MKLKRKRFERLEPRHCLASLILDAQPLIPTDATVYDAVDLDGDNDNDVILQRVAPDTNAITYQWLENLDGRGTWGELTALPDLDGQTWIRFGDLDGDGDADVVHRDDPHFAWREFQGDRYGLPVSLSFGEGDIDTCRESTLDTWHLVDYDADSDLDLLGLLWDDCLSLSSLHIADNDGTGNFALREDRKLGLDQSGAYEMLVSDITGDQQPDLVLGLTNFFDEYKFSGAFLHPAFSENGDRVRVGGSSDRADLHPSLVSLSSGDIDSDGQTDVLMLLEDGVEWHLSQNGFFYRRALAGPVEGTFEDIDADGDLDWITPDFTWLEHTDLMSFAPQQPIVEGLAPTGFRLVDIDNNGHLDLLVSTADGFQSYRVSGSLPGELSISGTVWQDQDLNGVRDAGENGVGGVTVFMDLDNDGMATPNEPAQTTDRLGRFQFPDLSPGTYTIRQLPPSDFYQSFPQTSGAVIAAHDVVLESDLEIEFHVWQPRIPTIELRATEIVDDEHPDDRTRPRGVHAADIDGDGFVDLVRQSRDLGLQWLRNLGTGNEFSQPQPIDAGNRIALGIQSIDIDGDSDLDILVSNGRWYENVDGQGLFTSQPNPIPFIPSSYVADFDGNGVLDSLFAQFDVVELHYGFDGGTRYEMEHIGGAFTDQPIEPPEVADLDGDGDLDIVWGEPIIVFGNDFFDAQVVWQENLGEAGFGPMTDIGDVNVGREFLQLYDIRLALADFDNDGDLDPVSGWTGDERDIRWYLNEGDGQFSAEPIVMGQFPQTQDLVEVDLNSDGYIDIFMPKNGWLMNLPDALRFSQGDVLGVSDSWEFIDVVDFDNDGIDELLGIDSESDRVTILHNVTARALAEADLTDDGIISADDLDAMTQRLASGQPTPDLNQDGTSNRDDLDYLVVDLLQTCHGDVNLDGVFNSTDLVLVFQAAEYEDELPSDSRWTTGDWNGDGEFDSSDLVYAFQVGNYTL